MKEGLKMLKFMYNGLKVDNVLYKASYSAGPYTAESKLPSGTVSIYASNYKHFPRILGLTVTNNSEIIEDYHETDKIRIYPSSPYYSQALEAHTKQECHRAARMVYNH